MLRLLSVFIVVPVAVFAFGYPMAAWFVHGFNTASWPDGGATLRSWFAAMSSLDVMAMLERYLDLWTWRSDLFPGYGRLVVMALMVPPGLWAGIAVARAAGQPKAEGPLGRSRFATSKELSRLSRGLEIGIDPTSKYPVRVFLESNAISFAPPRTGKSSGLIMPNLLAPDRGGWSGPAIVVDPKGELYHATADRRRALGARHGRTVRCLDPYNLAGGEDRWNPFDGLTPDDTRAIGRMVGAMLVETGDQNLYFRQRATTVLKGLIVALLENGPTDPSTVRNTLLDRDALIDLSQGSDHPAVVGLKAILNMDEKSSASILSTAETAFDWLQDQDMEMASGTSTFSLTEVSRGKADLFIIIPGESQEELAPWTRVIFSEIFAAVRRERQPGDERIVAFIDEAATLKRFSQLQSGVGELPGYGLSIWTFWQTRAQIETYYQETGLSTFLATAAVTTMSDLPQSLENEAQDWSNALGATTHDIVSTSQQDQDRHGRSTSPQRVPLMQPEDITAMSSDQLLAFIRTKDGQQRAAVLNKTRPFRERRFKRHGRFEQRSPVME